MIKGTHNSLTGYPLKGWQKYFKCLIQPFCCCQKDGIMVQYKKGVRLFEIQCAYKNGRLIGSHGVALYDTPKVNGILSKLNDLAKEENIYIILGLDNHCTTAEDRYRFRADVVDFLEKYPNLTFLYAFIENPWNIVYKHLFLAYDIYYGYWRLNWAKEMCKHWWQFYYYLPVPRLWKWIYGRKWDKEAEESGKMFYLTDFV